MKEELRKKLKKMHYGLVGEKAAVQICLWTKRELRGEGGCWKQKFYGISSAGCCQMTPNVMNCENRCLHCWRPIEHNEGIKIEEKPMKPEILLEEIIKERKKLMMGFLGNKKVKKEDFEKSLEPKLYTTSLSGEPTLYPYLGELFTLIRKKGAVSFLVTNGQNPDAIKELEKKGFPTQITVSTNAPNKKLFLKWHNSCHKDAWERFQKTLEVINNLNGKVRRVIRLTLVNTGKTKNTSHPKVSLGNDSISRGTSETSTHNEISNMLEVHLEQYAKIIKKANPDFIHIKGFKSVGYSRERFGYDKQPWFEEVKNYSKKLLTLLDNNYEIKGEDETSSVILIAKKGKELEIKKV